MSGSFDDPYTWLPPGSTPDSLWEERSNFNGVVLSCAAYGVHFTLYLIVLQHLVKHPPHRSSGKRKVPWALVSYITWNFMLGTFGIAAESKFNQLTFIDARNFPGGPNAFVAAEYGNFINIFGTSAYVVLNWFADGLVIYRYWLIYNFNYYAAVLPVLLLLGSVTMGIILLFQLTQPNANLWSKTTVNFGIPYWSISAGLNVFVTSLIVARLLLIRRRTRAVLSSHHSRTYTSVAAMLIESAALYSATVLLFVVTYARDSNVQNLVLPVLGQVQAICPLLIMWRVARGQAISRETIVSTSLPTTSKMSWRNATFRTATSVLGRSTASSRAKDVGASNTGPTQSLALPVFSAKYPTSVDEVSKATTGDEDKYMFEGDEDSGWEMASRNPRSAGSAGTERKQRVEIVVEHEVQRWEPGEERRPTSREGVASAV